MTDQDRDWPTFWRSLTPEQAWECLRAAPKVAGAWTRDPAFDRWLRHSPHDGHVVASVSSLRRDEADAALRAAGWVLVGDEDVSATPNAKEKP